MSTYKASDFRDQPCHSCKKLEERVERLRAAFQIIDSITEGASFDSFTIAKEALKEDDKLAASMGEK